MQAATVLLDYARLARPWQWTKNLLCLAGAVFTLVPLTPVTLEAALLVTTAFCMFSSATYVFNDIVDRRLDAEHPRKCLRPLPAGRIPVKRAAVFGLALLVAGTACAVASATPGIGLLIGGYLALNLAYSLWLKGIALVDVFCISIGFILRLVAGIIAVRDTPTAWIIVCTLFLTLFIGFTKRRSEIASGGSKEQRPVLSGYSIEFLESLIGASATMSILSYAIFTINSGRDPTLVVTILPVVFGIFHFRHRTHFSNATESPDLVLLKDKVIMACIACWIASFLYISHTKPHFFR